MRYTEAEIGGKKRPLKFGINQTEIFCKTRGITAGEFIEMFTEEKLNALALTGGEVRDLVWSGLKDGARFKKQEFKYTPEDIGDWIDEMSMKDPKKFQEVMTAIFQSIVMKPGAEKEGEVKEEKAE